MMLLKTALIALALTTSIAHAECTQEEITARMMYGASIAVGNLVDQCLQHGYFTIDIGKAQPLYFVCNLGQMSMEDTDEVEKESNVSERSRG